MARIAGRVADFSYNLIDMEDELASIEMSVDNNLPEVTCFGDVAATFVEGVPTSSFALSGFWNEATGEGDATFSAQIGSGEAAFVFQPTGATPNTNDPNYVGNAILKSYRIRAEVGGPVTYDAELQVNGANTRDVIP